MSSPKVFILILNYNGKATLADCLRSVYRTHYPNFEVVVIDNHSQDGSFEAARQLFPRAHFIQNTANLGFSAGNNVGIRFVLQHGAQYVWLLNNDATIKPNTLSRLIATSQRYSRSGILSPLILHSKSKDIWFTGGAIKWLSMKTVHTPLRSLDTPIPSGYICGCAMLIKRSVLEQVGLFDERFFLYYEDADLSLRAKQKGFQLLVVPSARAYHSETSVHNPKKIYWLVFSGLQFFNKHTHRFLRPWYTVFFFARRIKNVFDVQFRPTTTAKQVAHAYQDFLNLPH